MTHIYPPLTASTRWEDREPLTLEIIKETLRLLPEMKDPLEEYMIEHGFPPKQGGRMWWPAELAVPWGMFCPPYYVKVTRSVAYPMMFFTEYCAEPVKESE